MILVCLLVIPGVAGLLAWWVNRWSHRGPRWVCMTALGLMLVVSLQLWAEHPLSPISSRTAGDLLQLDLPWIPALGIRFHLALDGLSLLLILLTAFLGMIAVAASWHEIRDRVGFFHLNLMWVLTGIVGVFLAMDLFLFYFFWEMMLIPMYFLIALWGHENRIYASIKFFLFTQISGLLMLVAILGLSFVHYRQTGVFTFDYLDLLGTSLPGSTGFWLMMGFFAAFAVKLPAVPLHTWLADAHTEAPTAGSVILAGLLLKTGAYGMLRFLVPLFPEAVASFAPIGRTLGTVSILYGALLAFSQTDLKRLVAYTSVSHMGFVLLGIFALNELAVEGVVMQMISHGVSTGALFVLVGALQERMHTRDVREMGGLWATLPRMGAVMLLFVLASLGLPGLGNFVGEFLVLLGTYPVSLLFTCLATLGLVGATVYALWLLQVSFLGPNRRGWSLPDLSPREGMMTGSMIVVILWLGLYPQPVLRTVAGAMDRSPIRTVTGPGNPLEASRGGDGSPRVWIEPEGIHGSR